MITSNTTNDNPFSLAFTTRKEIPHAFLKNRLVPVKTEAMIDKKKTEIEIHDFMSLAFDSLYLAEMLIRTGTGKTAEEVQDGLVARFGNAIRSSIVYIVLYKKIK